MNGPDLYAALAAFDDAALATLANPGLVRRACRDVADGKVRLVGEEGEAAVLMADGQRVVLGRRGPSAAACACRAVAVCRHRLAAAIFLRDMAGEDGTASAETPDDILAPFALAAVEKWAGKAAWRAALELAQAAGEVVEGDQAIAVAFPDLDGPVRILRGQGLDGIVSKAGKTRRKATHAAAVLAALQRRGMVLPNADAESEGPDAASAAPDPAFLARVRVVLVEVAALGFNLAPLPLEEALFALSVSTRADGLPRLAALLRAIAAQVRLRRGRKLDFDPDRLLELAATAFALSHALERSDPERRSSLAGRLRRAYAPAEPLELLGCGGERWSTPTGARGVTAWFLELATGRWLSASIARAPGQDPAFRPAQAWREQTLWHAAPLAVLAHARFRLEGAHRSPDGRLSAPAGARATVIARDADPSSCSPALVRDWSALHARWAEEAGLGLDSADAPAACLLAPAAVAPPVFDDLAQELVWPVSDAAGRWLALTLPHEEPMSPAIAALEAVLRAGWTGTILVRIDRAGDRLSVRPVTLFGSGEPVDLAVWTPPRREAAAPAAARDWLARLRARPARAFAAEPRSGTDAALADAWRHLLGRLETGPALARSLDGGLEREAERLARFGLSCLAGCLRAAIDGTGVLTAAYALLLARRQRCRVPLLR